MTGRVSRVLIVDDSPAMCRFLSEILSSDPLLEVVGHALDPFEAREKIKRLQPDVLTLDVEMPKMDGISFLKNLMRLRPMPVVMVSSLTAAGAEITLSALSIGAVDFVVKRHPGGPQELNQYIEEIVSRVRGAASVRLDRRQKAGKQAAAHPEYVAWQKKFNAMGQVQSNIARIIAIGASTGGPEAIKQVLADLNVAGCSVVISQHMPERFMSAFAERLNRNSQLAVGLAVDGERLKPGRCYVAPGDLHMALRKGATGLEISLNREQRRNGHRPSVDEMFDSVAKIAGGSAVGVLLTGMGNDGAAGLKAMSNAGSLTLAQDERSSAVWSMPGAAVKLGATDGVLSLGEIGPLVSQLSACLKVA